jgi:hypothetical protein
LCIRLFYCCYLDTYIYLLDAVRIRDQKHHHQLDAADAAPAAAKLKDLTPFFSLGRLFFATAFGLPSINQYVHTSIKHLCQLYYKHTQAHRVDYLSIDAPFINNPQTRTPRGDPQARGKNVEIRSDYHNDYGWRQDSRTIVLTITSTIHPISGRLRSRRQQEERD